MREHMTIGLSSCPNDTFIFHALLHNLIASPGNMNFSPHIADVERLNNLAIREALPITKISLGVMPHIYSNYSLLSAGAALGWGCGPLVVARDNVNNLEAASIAIPGNNTTATMLLEMTNMFNGPRIEMVFDQVLPAVASGKADAGVIIHEGRFTYSKYGLKKVLDLGQWWEEKFHLPLPLGAIAISRKVEKSVAMKIQDLISESLCYAWANPEKSREFINQNAQELDNSVIEAHINTFVTDFSQNLGEAGKAAIRALLKSSCKGAMADKLFVDEW